MKKIKKIFKLYSYIIFPAIIAVFLKWLMKKTIIEFDAQNIVTLIGVIVTLIGILLTVLTIYLSFPKSDRIVERMKQTRHNEILLKNIFCGICLLQVTLIIWMFSSNYDLIVILLVSSFSNIIICGYYLYALSKL